MDFSEKYYYMLGKLRLYLLLWENKFKGYESEAKLKTHKSKTKF